jgi:hypothetical protein
MSTESDVSTRSRVARWIDANTRSALVTLCVSVVFACVGYVFRSWDEGRDADRRREEELMQQALSADDPADRAARLRFLVDHGFVEDRNGRILRAAQGGAVVPSPADRPPAPPGPVFNRWPTSYVPRPFHDLALIDGFVTGGKGRRGRFASTAVEHAEGLVVEAGDRVVVSLYFHNVATPAVEGAAVNVRAVVDTVRMGPAAYSLVVNLVSDNTVTAGSDSLRGGNLRLRSHRPVRLLYVPASTRLCLRPTGGEGMPPNRMRGATACASAAGSGERAAVLPDGIVEAAVYLGMVGGGTDGLITFEMEVASAG